MASSSPKGTPLEDQTRSVRVYGKILEQLLEVPAAQRALTRLNFWLEQEEDEHSEGALVVQILSFLKQYQTLEELYFPHRVVLRLTTEYERIVAADLSAAQSLELFHSLSQCARLETVYLPNVDNSAVTIDALEAFVRARAGVLRVVHIVVPKLTDYVFAMVCKLIVADSPLEELSVRTSQELDPAYADVNSVVAALRLNSHLVHLRIHGMNYLYQFKHEVENELKINRHLSYYRSYPHPPRNKHAECELSSLFSEKIARFSRLKLSQKSYLCSAPRKRLQTVLPEIVDLIARYAHISPAILQPDYGLTAPDYIYSNLSGVNYLVLVDGYKSPMSVPAEVLLLSQTVLDMTEALGEEGRWQPIPLLDIEAPMLQLVLYYGVQSYGCRGRWSEHLDKGTLRLHYWEFQFMAKLTTQQIMDLFAVCNYLNYVPLLHALCKYLALKLNKLSPAKLEEYFSVERVNDEHLRKRQAQALYSVSEADWRTLVAQHFECEQT